MCISQVSQWNARLVSCLGIWWRHEIWKCRNKKRFWKEIKNIFLHLTSAFVWKQTRTSSIEGGLETFYLTLNSSLFPGKCHPCVYIINLNQFDPRPLKNFCLKKNWIRRSYLFSWSDYTSVNAFIHYYPRYFEQVSVIIFNTCSISTLKTPNQRL